MVRLKSKSMATVLILAMGLNVLAPVASSFAAEDTLQDTNPIANDNSSDKDKVDSEDLKQAQEAVIQAKKEVDEAKAELSDAETNLEAAKKEQEAADAKLAAAEKAQKEAQEAKAAADKEYQEALEKQNEAAEVVIDLLEKEGNQQDAENNLKQAQADLDEAKKAKEQADNEVNTKEEDFLDKTLNLKNAYLTLDSAEELAEAIKEDYSEVVVKNLENEVTETEQKIKNIKDAQENQQKPEVSNEELDQSIADAQSAYDEAIKEYNNKKKEYEDAKAKLDTGKANLAAKEEELATKSQELDLLADEYLEAFDKLADGSMTQEEFDELEDKYDALDEEVANLEKEVETLNYNLNGKDREVENKEKAYRDLKDSIGNKKDDLDLAKGEKDAFDKIVNGEINKENYEETVTQVDEDIDRLNTKADDELELKKQAEYNYAQFTEDKLRKLKDEIETAEMIRDNKTGYWKEKDVEGAKKLLEDYLYPQLASWNKDKAAAKKALEEVEETYDKTLEELSKAYGQSVALDSYGDLIDSLDQYNKTKEQLAKDLEEAGKKLAADQQALDEAKEELKFADEQLAEAEKELEDSAKERDDAQKALEDAYKARKTANDKVKELEDKIKNLQENPQTSESTDELEKAKAELEKVKKDAEDKKTIAEDKANDLKDANKKLEAAQEEKTAADKKVKEAYEKVQEAKDKVIEKQDKLLTAEEKQALEQAKDNLRKLAESAKAIDDDKLQEVIRGIEADLEKDLTVADINGLHDKLIEAIANAKTNRPVIDELDSLKDLYKDFIDKLSKLSPAEKDAFKELIDKADSRAKIQSIYTDAIAKNNKELGNVDKPVDPEPETPVVDELASLKDLYKGFIDKLSKLSPAEREEFKELIDEASSRAKIQSIYNDAIAKNNKELGSVDKPVNPNPVDPKPVDPVVDGLETYRDLISSYIRGLSKLSPVEKDLYIARVQAAKTRADIQAIYNQAIGLNNGRIIREFQPVDPILPQPQSPEISRPVYPTPGPVVTRPTDDSEVLEVSSDIIYIPAGYKNFNAGFYSKAKLVKEYKILLKAYNANVITVRSAKMLLEEYPKTVAPVKDKLEALLKTATHLQKEALTMLNEYEEVLKLDKTLA